MGWDILFRKYLLWQEELLACGGITQSVLEESSAAADAGSCA